MTDGFLRVAAVSPQVTVADVDANVDRIKSEMHRLDAMGVEVAVFPEMCITGYTCADLLHNRFLLDKAAEGLGVLAAEANSLGLDAIVGLPLVRGGAVRNCAVLIGQGEPQVIEKTYLPDYNEFYERRWFSSADPAESGRVFESHGARIGVEICEDLWAPVPPSCALALSGAQVIFNLSASNDVIGKYAYTRSLISQQSARLHCAYVYASAGYGESSTDLVFTPKDIVAECGNIIAENDRMDSDAEHHCAIADVDIMAIERDRLHFTTFSACAKREGVETDRQQSHGVYDTVTDRLPEYRFVDPHPFVPSTDDAIDERCSEIIFIQESGLARRLEAIHCTTLTVGISGGLDSTLALLVAIRTFDRMGLDRKGIVAVTMPGFGTTGRTYRNAMKLMQLLGVTIREVPIADAVNLHFRDIGHDPAVQDVTYENSQARYRTMVLMDIANQTGGIVLGTGDLSELALGWATYNGDHMSMYGVNAGVPKTLVRYLVRWFAMRAATDQEREVLLDIIDTPISPELKPADEKGDIKQKTEEFVGPYELSDFFLYYMLRYGFPPRRVYLLARKAFAGVYSDEVILKWLRDFYRRFFMQQFKRSCLPDGPKVGSVCLSPRGDWRMPSDASVAMWLREVDSL